MSIATSLDKLSETLTNCKTNLKEKGVEADSIKISDVDEKIMEIQAGGGEETDLIESAKKFTGFIGFIDTTSSIKSTETFTVKISDDIYEKYLKQYIKNSYKIYLKAYLISSSGCIRFDWKTSQDDQEFNSQEFIEVTKGRIEYTGHPQKDASGPEDLIFMIYRSQGGGATQGHFHAGIFLHGVQVIA